MSLALIRKELREHGWVFGAVAAFDAVTLAVQLVAQGLGRTQRGGRADGLVGFLCVLALAGELSRCGRQELLAVGPLHLCPHGAQRL